MPLTLEKVPAGFHSAMLHAHMKGTFYGNDFAKGFERYVHNGEEWVNREGQNVHEYVADVFGNFSQYSDWTPVAAYWNSFGEASCEIWDRFEAGLVEGAVGVDSGD